MKLLRRAMFGMLFLLSVTATLAWGEDDPPGRVARLQYFQGSVSVQPRGDDGWVAGTVNRPLTTSDNIWADKDSRAELNVATGVLRMNGETSLTLTNVSDNTVQVQLHQGTLNLRVRHLYPGEIYEVDTPNMAFTVQKSGRYRFDVDPNGDITQVTVWKGEGDATGNSPAVRVRAHQRARFSGTYLAHEIDRAPAYDGFDDWCLVRDRRQDHAITAQYVSPGVIGYEDLDDYGSWRVLPAYGPVWTPAYVVPGWSPYHYGHWVWVSPWGWTWVDDAPWGFAPFHYGRWVYAGYWAWVPGPVYVRPVYAPALVAWFGGSGFSIGISFGGYGWCPLGYGEPYVPWYGGSRRYFQRVNVTNTHITNITNITNNYYGNDDGHRSRPITYRNLNAPGAVTVVSRRTIVDSLPVAKTAVAVTPKDAKEWARNPVREVSLTPTRDSRLGPAARTRTVAPPEHVTTRPVLTKMTPPLAPAKTQQAGPPDVKFERPLPARIADNEPPANLPKPARVIPRPPQSGIAASAVAPPSVPKPPSSTGDESRAQPRTARVVPRPPDVNHERNIRELARPAAPTTNRDPAQPSSAPSHSTLPAVRQVPRPPTTDNTTARDEGSRVTLPRSIGDPGSRQHDGEVPRPSGPVAVPRGSGPDEHVPRIAPPSSVYRPSGPDEHRPIVPPGASPVQRGGEISAPRSSGDVPRSFGDAPRMQAPPAPSSIPQAAPPSSNSAPAAPPARSSPPPAARSLPPTDRGVK